MADAKVSLSGQRESDRRNGTPISRAQDAGIDAIVRLDATIAALQEQRAEIIAINGRMFRSQSAA